MSIEQKKAAEGKESASNFQEQLAQMKKDLIGDGSLSANDWSMAGNIDKLSKTNPGQEGYAKWKTDLHRWMKAFGEKLNRRIDIANKNGTFEEHEDVLNELKVRFEEIIVTYKSLPAAGATGKEAQNKPYYEELAGLEPKSNFRDLPINGANLAGMEPQRLLARSNKCEYYLVAIPNVGWGIMRIGINNNVSDEIAFLPLDGQFEGEQLVQMIRGAETSGGFRDVEIDGSSGTWGDVAAQATTGAGIGAGVGFLGGAGAFSWLTAPIGAGVGGLTGVVTGMTTDEDFTAADLDKLGLRKKFDAVKTNPKS